MISARHLKYFRTHFHSNQHYLYVIISMKNSSRHWKLFSTILIPFKGGTSIPMSLIISENSEENEEDSKKGEELRYLKTVIFHKKCSPSSSVTIFVFCSTGSHKMYWKKFVSNMVYIRRLIWTMFSTFISKVRTIRVSKIFFPVKTISAYLRVAKLIISRK